MVQTEIHGLLALMVIGTKMTTKQSGKPSEQMELKVLKVLKVQKVLPEKMGYIMFPTQKQDASIFTKMVNLLKRQKLAGRAVA